MSGSADIRTVNTLPGSEFPLGATVTGTGTNFAVASEVADGMTLCLFDQAGADQLGHVGAKAASGLRAVGGTAAQPGTTESVLVELLDRLNPPRLPGLGVHPAVLRDGTASAARLVLPHGGERGR